MESSKLDTTRSLQRIDVRVQYKDSTSTRSWLRVKPKDTLRKIRTHITESLDIQGRVMYRDQNCDDFPAKRLSDYPTDREEILFCLIAEKRSRDMKQHLIELILPNELTHEHTAKTVSMKVARTTTIGNLKHKIQDEHGIPVEEQRICLPGQNKECPSTVNVMQLSGTTLELKLQKKEASPPPRQATCKRAASLKDRSLASGTPYATKLGRRNSLEHSSIHPSLRKVKKKTEPEEAQSSLSSSLQHATFEAIYELGKNLEKFKNDKTKKVVVECEHSKDKENTVNITSKLVDTTPMK